MIRGAHERVDVFFDRRVRRLLLGQLPVPGDLDTDFDEDEAVGEVEGEVGVVQEPYRVVPSRRGPVDEPVGDFEEERVVNAEFVKAATGLAAMVWYSGERPLSRFLERGHRADIDDYVGYASGQGWVRVEDRDSVLWVVRGRVDPRGPAEPF